MDACKQDEPPPPNECRPSRRQIAQVLQGHTDSVTVGQKNLTPAYSLSAAIRYYSWCSSSNRRRSKSRRRAASCSVRPRRRILRSADAPPSRSAERACRLGCRLVVAPRGRVGGRASSCHCAFAIVTNPFGRLAEPERNTLFSLIDSRRPRRSAKLFSTCSCAGPVAAMDSFPIAIRASVVQSVMHGEGADSNRNRRR